MHITTQVHGLGHAAGEPAWNSSYLRCGKLGKGGKILARMHEVQINEDMEVISHKNFKKDSRAMK